MKPFKPTKTKPLNESEKVFNYWLSRARRCVENAFGILCSKNYCLGQTMHCGPDRAKQIIKTCVYLHNFMIRTRKEKYCPSNHPKIDSLSTNSLFYSNLGGSYHGRIDDCGTTVRNKLKEYFNSDEGSVLWQIKSAFLNIFIF